MHSPYFNSLTTLGAIGSFYSSLSETAELCATSVGRLFSSKSPEESNFRPTWRPNGEKPTHNNHLSMAGRFAQSVKPYLPLITSLFSLGYMISYCQAEQLLKTSDLDIIFGKEEGGCFMQTPESMGSWITEAHHILNNRSVISTLSDQFNNLIRSSSSDLD